MLTMSADVFPKTPFSHSEARFDPPGEDPSDPERRMPEPSDQAVFAQPQDAFRGIWHGQPDFFPEYGPKYGGGLGTYPYQTRPMAVYSAAARKTFFCWGGTTAASDPWTRPWDFVSGGLLQMVSAFDHARDCLLEPICVFDKWCADPHDNPALQIDGEGYLWLFSPSHGEWTTRSFIHRSKRPFDHTAWETVSDGPLFAYPQPWYDVRWGWMFLHTQYQRGRGLWLRRGSDGRRWSAPVPLVGFGAGHYQVSFFDECHRCLCLAFDYHPEVGGLEARTNLYYMESLDGGRTFRNAAGQWLDLPLQDRSNAALVHDYEAEGLKVYLRDVKRTRRGDPVILYVTSKGFEPGPANGPHQWRLASWSSAGGWRIQDLFVSDNNYDHGELSIGERDWRIIAPTSPGPQRWNPGGEVDLWVSADEGRTWCKETSLTHNSSLNHTFCRMPLKAHPDFQAFWADGNAREPSPSSLYFCNRSGSRVRRMK
jgi:hypothetical protein